MADYFFDSSAIVKRYAREKGSARVEALAANQEGDTPLLTFLSADADLLDAASREHLLVENPGA